MNAPNREDQILAAVRAAAEPLIAIGRNVPAMEDASVRADVIRLGHLRWLVASGGRALRIRSSALAHPDETDLAAAVLDDVDASDLPDGVPPALRSLRVARDGEVVADLIPLSEAAQAALERNALAVEAVTLAALNNDDGRGGDPGHN